MFVTVLAVVTETVGIAAVGTETCVPCIFASTAATRVQHDNTLTSTNITFSIQTS